MPWFCLRKIPRSQELKYISHLTFFLLSGSIFIYTYSLGLYWTLEMLLWFILVFIWLAAAASPQYWSFPLPETLFPKLSLWCSHFFQFLPNKQLQEAFLGYSSKAPNSHPNNSYSICLLDFSPKFLLLFNKCCFTYFSYLLSVTFSKFHDGRNICHFCLRWSPTHRIAPDTENNFIEYVSNE